MRKLCNPYNLSGKKLELITKFWKEYGRYYDADVRYNFRHHLLSAFREDDLPLLYLSIYSYLEIIPNRKDVYKWFLNYLKNTHKDFLEHDILEVGCGSVPALTKHIATNMLELGSKGTIKGIDENLIVSEIFGAELQKESFAYNTDISSADTIIGYAPCEATPIALRKACREKKELSIAVCECLHSDGSFFTTNYDKLLNHYYRLVKREMSSDFIFDINQVPKEYNMEFPILTLKRK
ncbi:MAG: hypothetical protein IJN03_00780 [Bacilli bacterium]|nr:hypothetical protein [Bacilli bacterium]